MGEPYDSIRAAEQIGLKGAKPVSPLTPIETYILERKLEDYVKSRGRPYERLAKEAVDECLKECGLDR